MEAVVGNFRLHPLMVVPAVTAPESDPAVVRCRRSMLTIIAGSSIVDSRQEQ